MKNILTAIFLISSIGFASCNNPLEKKYNARTFEQDIEEIRKSNKVNYEDIELLAKYIIISRLSGNDLQGQTYSDILDKIKSTNAIIGQQKNEELQRGQRLSRFLNVSLIEKGFTKINNNEVLTFNISFQNLAAKDIATVIGSIRLNDLLEREIKKVDILLDENIDAHGTFKKLYTIDYNPDDESDKRIRSKQLIDLRVEWNPEKIIFKDGKIAD